jgi:hypothetical protein
MNKERYDKIIDECRALVISRNEQYGDTVDVVDIHTLVGLCIMKLSRIYQLGVANTKSRDELIDSINYLVFCIEKLNRKTTMEKVKLTKEQEEKILALMQDKVNHANIDELRDALDYIEKQNKNN